MEYQFHTLNNGICIVHHHVDSAVAHCGIFINAGTRDEKIEEHGLAHFIEHVIFKGTKKRKVYHVLNRLESVGGDLNAFTTKEETCVYASFLNRYYDRTLELISDILFNSVFPDKELEKEKDVIYEEINSYKDSPIEKIYDDFEEILFNGHLIGRNILGTKRNIKKFRRGHILNFMKDHYRTDQMVICSVANVDFKKLIRMAEKYFASVTENNKSLPRTPYLGYSPVSKSINKRTYQTHCIIGNIAYPYMDRHMIPMALLNNLLGGPGLNSRLNLSIREKHGMAYNNESSYTPYSDTGIFSIYLGIDNGSIDRTLSYVYKELEKLRENKLGVLQLKSAKQQFVGQLAIAYESNLARMLSMGKSMILTNDVQSIDKIHEQIEAVTADTIIEMANEIFDQNMLSMLTFLSK